MPGKLIVIEGLDGSGKSTQTELLQKNLQLCLSIQRELNCRITTTRQARLSECISAANSETTRRASTSMRRPRFMRWTAMRVTAVIGKRIIFRVRSFSRQIYFVERRSSGGKAAAERVGRLY